jgi:hypothetical protein
MIRFDAITANAKTTIRNNAAFNAWCIENFGKQAKIFIGIDEGNPPRQEDCPFVAISCPQRMAGVEADTIVYQMIVTFGVTSEDVSIDTNGDQTLIGLTLMSQMWEKLWLALVAGFSDNVFLSEEDTTLEGVITFPMFIGASQININIPNLIGAEITL